ncbi:hypothetical protein TBLA_0B09860 [Henningerozyma blattae CBS 6284]|uniref:Uncharacterized protein n=1 Tax=Henningerozyma blattae (strain ATCC 34711 / CBS 6284 / DSM 70876 / NBRC 10599 / NRRL Y-10934 / UCD 77-7) TaxID=1071380 RepID=I2H0A2_HENB6|nr:hypothetical protein TBLA_0B09860 [Tetrapisispora blattae CBS 6284]CCH59804.1 hypothetical protein TBLA_0B09860 [Tetrapisispora blattae CBS 6284]
MLFFWAALLGAKVTGGYFYIQKNTQKNVLKSVRFVESNVNARSTSISNVGYERKNSNSRNTPTTAEIITSITVSTWPVTNPRIRISRILIVCPAQKLFVKIYHTLQVRRTIRPSAHVTHLMTHSSTQHTSSPTLPQTRPQQRHGIATGHPLRLAARGRPGPTLGLPHGITRRMPPGYLQGHLQGHLQDILNQEFPHCLPNLGLQARMSRETLINQMEMEQECLMIKLLKQIQCLEVENLMIKRQLYKVQKPPTKDPHFILTHSNWKNTPSIRKNRSNLSKNVTYSNTPRSIQSDGCIQNTNIIDHNYNANHPNNNNNNSYKSRRKNSFSPLEASPIEETNLKENLKL